MYIEAENTYLAFITTISSWIHIHREDYEPPKMVFRQTMLKQVKEVGAY